jgi:adenylate cyclase
MFADIVGFTSMMQENEFLAKTMRDRHRAVLLEEIKKHGGEVLQFYGDGTMSIFNSSIQAVMAAVNVQQKMVADDPVPLRIGLHAGDIVQDAEGIYGDGVNVASRIESLSVAGSVLISDKLYDDIKNHRDFLTVPLGQFMLKNVKRPIEVYAIHKSGLKIPNRKELEGKTDLSYKSIAVLPFLNLSNDPENEYFSDGITEEVIHVLTKVKEINVTSRTSSFVFKNKNMDVREIGQMLNVNTILEGSVRRSGKRVRVTAQLINTQDGYHFWSENFNGNLDDIFELQDNISEAIVAKLRDTLSGRQFRDGLSRSQIDLRTKNDHQTKNIDAYKLYLKAQYHANKFTPDQLKLAIKYYQQAIETQPDYAPAYSGIAYVYGYFGVTGQLIRDIAYPKSMEYAQKSMELDENHYGSHLVYAMCQVYFTNNLDTAYQHFRIALDLAPGSAEVHLYYAMYLLVVGNMGEAQGHLDQAIELDPMSLPIRSYNGTYHLFKRMYFEARKIYEDILHDDPDFRSALEGMGWTYYLTGEVEKAIDVLHQYQSETGHPLKGWTTLGHIYGATGQMDKAEEVLKKMNERELLEPEISLHIDYAIIYAGMERFKDAAEEIEKEIQGSTAFLYLFMHPLWDRAKKDNHFVEKINHLLEKKGISGLF